MERGVYIGQMAVGLKRIDEKRELVNGWLSGIPRIKMLSASSVSVARQREE